MSMRACAYYASSSGAALLLAALLPADLSFCLLVGGWLDGSNEDDRMEWAVNRPCWGSVRSMSRPAKTLSTSIRGGHALDRALWRAQPARHDEKKEGAEREEDDLGRVDPSSQQRSRPPQRHHGPGAPIARIGVSDLAVGLDVQTRRSIVGRRTALRSERGRESVGRGARQRRAWGRTSQEKKAREAAEKKRGKGAYECGVPRDGEAHAASQRAPRAIDGWSVDWLGFIERGLACLDWLGVTTRGGRMRGAGHTPVHRSKSIYAALR